MSTGASIEINKPLAEVFKFVAEDFTETYPLWAFPEILSVEKMTEGPIRRETQGRITLSKKLTTDFQITEFEPLKKLEFS